MREDLTVFWKNNARAYELFADLLARAEHSAYDDEFLKQLAAYREETPESERADIFAAQYLLHHGDAEGAAVCGERAYARRPVNYEVWKVLASAYQHLGRAMESITMQGYAYGLYQAPPLQINLTEESLQEELGRLSMAVGWGNYAPITKRRAVIENSQMSFRSDIFVGEHLPLTMPTGSARFWVGIYTESRFLSEPSYMISAVRHCDAFMDYGHRDFFFDLHKARECQGTTQIHVPKGQELLISLAGTEETEQKITLQTSHSKTAFYLGKWAFSYFRLSEDTTLHAESDTSYAVGTPIYLGHHPQRKKLVLNILFDALSWPVVRTRFPACMPHIASFFTKGLIFGQTFSTSEHTYPAHPAIETGRYPQHTHLFNERDSHELFPDCVTLAESMKRLGYYCSAPMASNNGIYCGLMRGYDRITMASWHLPSSEGVERTIGHIDAFNETDQFLFLHITDVHPFHAKGFKFLTSVETQIPLARRGIDIEQSMASVRLPNNELYQAQFWGKLRHADRHLGQLFSYIEETYAEDEYIVNLYSDHGVSIFSPNFENGDVDIIGEYSTGAAWMLRGAGVPQGVVTDELTSITDIYPTLGHLCGFPVAPDIDGNLPAAFGGQERDAVYSASMFPGQTYKLAVRNQTHALRLETREVVDEDGTVDFADATVGIYPRAHELKAGCATDSEDLRAFFYPRARGFVHSIANNGEFWPAMRAARPAWFGEKEGQI